MNNRQRDHELQQIYELIRELHEIFVTLGACQPGYSDAIDLVANDLDQLADIVTDAALSNSSVAAAVQRTVRINLTLDRVGSVNDARGNDLLDNARHITTRLGVSIQNLYGWNRWLATVGRPADVSRRTRYAVGLAVRLLPPADRARYRQEFAAELADLPRCDQVPYAVRLACGAWSLRRSLSGKRGVRSTRVVVVVATRGAGTAVCLADLGWPAAVPGSVLIFALMWTVSSSDRTRHLASLIRAARSRPAPTRKR